MDGQYLKNKTRYLKLLDDWKNNIIKQKAWEKFDDLHVDKIAKEFKKPKSWVDGSLFLYDCILELIDFKIYDCILCIPLLDCQKPTYLDDLNIPYLKKNLNLTPPSFYLFPIGDYNYKQTIKQSIFLKNLSNQLNRKIYFKEVWEDEIYSRTIYIKNSRI